MRSDLVFIASEHVNNRFLLCHVVRVASRRFHKAGASIQETVNKVLTLVSEQAYNGATVDNKAEWEALFSDSTASHVAPRRLPQSANRPATVGLLEAPLENVG